MRVALAEHLETSAASRVQVAAGLGIAASTLSLYLNGSYVGDTKKIDNKVKGYLRRAKERTSSIMTRPKARFVKTRGAQMAFSVLRTCHLDGDMGMIIADPGLGKTQACREYARQNKDVILITPLKTCSMKTLLKQIADRLGGKTSDNNDLRARAIIQILKRSGRMILVDEAHFLTTSCLEILRQIHDAADIGLVYAGNEIFYQKVHKKELEQISSRIGIDTRLPELTEADHKLILQSTGIAVSEDAIKKVGEIANGSGRRGNKTFINACRIANGTEVSVQHILTADLMRKIA